MLERTWSLLGLPEAESPVWFAPYRSVATRVLACRVAHGTVCDALNAALDGSIRLSAGPLRFVPQEALTAGEAYESFIFRTACVPTRNHPHDLLNGLVWLRFPALKRHLNERQAEAIQGAGIGPKRGPVRDALTLFDENAALLQAPQAWVDALRQRQWHRLLWDWRDRWDEARVTVFGHALMETLWLRPHKSVTAHVWTAPLDVDVEAFMVRRLAPEFLGSRAHLPLPVMGLPGWCAENADRSFYDDAQVFRPLRR